jgi:hypothetical protein
MGVSSIVSISFSTLVKYLGVLNTNKHHVDITTHRRNNVMQKLVDVNIDIKVSTANLIRGLSLRLASREDKAILP